MLITESQLSLNRGTTSFELLDNMNYLTEAESKFDAALVPVVENKNIGGYLVGLEDIVSFAEANGIEDLGYALNLVCESSQIDPKSVTFSVNEDTIIADDEIASLTKQIMAEGVTVVAKPVSSAHPAAQIIDYAMNSFIESGSSYVLDCILQEEKMTPEKLYAARQNDPHFSDANVGKAQGDEDGDVGSANDVQGRVMTDSERRHFDKAAAEKAKADGILAKIKTYGNKGRDFIAKYIAKLHDWAAKIDKEISNDPDKRTVWQGIKKKIAQAIAWLSAKLSKIGTEQGGYRRDSK